VRLAKKGRTLLRDARERLAVEQRVSDSCQAVFRYAGSRSSCAVGGKREGVQVGWTRQGGVRDQYGAPHC